MPAENELSVREPATRGRGRGRGGRGGRGRGGGRGASHTTVSKITTTKPGRGGVRRGRAKSFNDSRVQAAYERQRHLKATYQAVAHALKPALQELAERNIEDALQNQDAHKHADEHLPVIRQLRRNLERKLAEHDRRLRWDLKLAEDMFHADNYVAEQEFTNGFEDIEEQFFQSQENRARILGVLNAKGLPADVRDDQYEYKVISDEHFDNDFGIYECYKDGHLIPYPSRVEGTEMWQKARDAEAAVAAAALVSGPAKGKGRGRGVNKRRAQDQPDGQPTPKKNTRGADDLLAPPTLAPPAPAKGLLASEVEVDPEGTPGDEESVPASPEPPNLSNGLAPTALVKTRGRLSAREKSPPLPKNIAEPDEYGFRIYNQRPSLRDKGINSRLLAPRSFWFEDWEIGFRDSSNDSSKSHTVAKRGKYLDTPNSNGMHFDHWCNGYDYSATTPEDFDAEKIKRHGLHPRYGMFGPNSVSEQEPGKPYVMPGKPVVYIANPSGRIHHASRSFLKTTNYHRSEETPWRQKIGASLRRFCKLDNVKADDIDLSEYITPDEELRERSLGTAIQELELRPEVKEEPFETEESSVVEELPCYEEVGFNNLSVLSYASAFIEAQGSTEVAPPPKPARYDAIRDVFTDAKPAAPPTPKTDINLGLNLLAELSNVVSGKNEPSSLVNGDAAQPADLPESDIRSTIVRDQEPLPEPAGQAPIDPRYQPSEVSHTYPPHPHQHPQPTLQPAGPMHTHAAEMATYPSHDHLVTQHQPVRPAEYQTHPMVSGPLVQDQGAYLSHNGYPVPDHRDAHMAAGRPIDPGFNPRRMSSYGSDAPAYNRPFWGQQAPSGPAGTPASVSSAAGPAQHYASQPPPASSRMPFSHSASAEPLPPLRPPRGRNQSVQEETPLDAGMRSSVHSTIGAPYYSSAHSRPYHRGYPGPESQPPTLQPISTDRILPNPQSGPNYIGSPHQAYAHPTLSPTYGNPPAMAGQMAQSPPDTPQGAHSSIHRHRSTPSGSSDASNNKYRKLQPAPVPAHRAWSNKPELKTIPYDHKETGSAAALPSSGPTTIRGWNVNQPRKRGKSDKNDRVDALHEREDSR